MAEEQKNNQDSSLQESVTEDAANISDQETAKISRVTEEMLENFSDKKKKKNDDDKNKLNIEEKENLEENNNEVKNKDKDNQDKSQIDTDKESASDKDSIDEEDTDNQELQLDDSEDLLIKDLDPEKTVVEFQEDKTKQPVKKPKKKRKPFFLLKVIGAIFLGILFILMMFGVWNRWFRYDDKQQLISSWQISGTNNIVVIDDKTIALASDAILNYTVDSAAKVIHYTIGDKSGYSHYRFSWDGSQLALIESTGSDPISTILSDLGWFWDYMTCKMSKIELSPAYTKSNKQEVDTKNTGLEDIISNGSESSILLDRISTKKPEQVL